MGRQITKKFNKGAKKESDNSEDKKEDNADKKTSCHVSVGYALLGPRGYVISAVL